MPEFVLPSFAKINWTLRILGIRADGFHSLFTVFQAISLRDTLYFSGSHNLDLSCDDLSVPIDERNLIMQAAASLRKVSGVTMGAKIHLEKRIPSPGGLGGGSSNAAVALIGLARLWELDLTTDELSAIAATLGSDIPFFLVGGTANGSGRGEILEPAADINESNLLIVTPKISVSTSGAFARLGAATLTNIELDHILSVCRSEADQLDVHRTALINDFEASVFADFPEIQRVKETLLELGAVSAALCGSGASVFAVFDNIETRQTAIKALDHESTWRKFAVATVSRNEYCEALGL